MNANEMDKALRKFERDMKAEARRVVEANVNEPEDLEKERLELQAEVDVLFGAMRWQVRKDNGMRSWRKR